MAYSIINKTKWGDCSLCHKTDCACVKKGKELVCVECNNLAKAQKQISNSNAKNKLRGLIAYQREEVGVDSIQELTIDLDRTISRYLRLRDMEKDGKVTCYTCDKRVIWQKIHCSHFINRSHMATRFLLDNLRCCCYECNIEKRGNLKAFAERLEKERAGTVDFLTEQSRTISNVSISDLKELLIEMQFKLKLVEKKLV